MACAKLSGQNIPCAARTYEKCALISNYNSSVTKPKLWNSIPTHSELFDLLRFLKIALENWTCQVYYEQQLYKPSIIS